MPRKALDIDAVAATFSLSKSQVYKLVRRPEDPLPHKKLGKVLRFDNDAIWKWFDRQWGPNSEV